MANEVPAALTLLKEWSTWLVSLQTGALGLVAFFTGKTSFGFSRPWLVASIASFAGSIFFATWVLAALPSVVQRIQDGTVKPNGFYDAPIFEWTFMWLPPLSWVTTAQHWVFIFGLAFFVVAIACGKPEASS